MPHNKVQRPNSSSSSWSQVRTVFLIGWRVALAGDSWGRHLYVLRYHLNTMPLHVDIRLLCFFAHHPLELLVPHLPPGRGSSSAARLSLPSLLGNRIHLVSSSLFALPGFFQTRFGVGTPHRHSLRQCRHQCIPKRNSTPYHLISSFISWSTVRRISNGLNGSLGNKSAASDRKPSRHWCKSMSSRGVSLSWWKVGIPCSPKNSSAPNGWRRTMTRNVGD